MISFHEVYKVIEAMTPLYVMIVCGYAAMKKGIFTPQEAKGISHLVRLFTLPFFILEFTSSSDPFQWNYKFLLADTIFKSILLVAWALILNPRKRYDWIIINFSLSALTNTLVVGVPLLNAMYGRDAIALVVQVAVIQYVIWFPLLLVLLEIRKNVTLPVTDHKTIPTTTTTTTEPHRTRESKIKSILSAVKTVGIKVTCNPNFFVSIIGVIWATISNRWNIQIPNIVEGSILILSKAATGTIMFSMGLFMAEQDHFIACGMKLALLSLVLKFFIGPAAMAISSVAVGLRGHTLYTSIVLAALPQSIVTFVYAKEYGLHPSVYSTAVIFGTITAVPIMIGYFAFLSIFS